MNEEKLTNGEIKEDHTETRDEMPMLSISKEIVDVEREVQKVEKQIELFNKVKIVSLKLTKEKDWVFQDGDSPYLMDRGAENVAIAWGINIPGNIELKIEWHEDEKGRYYAFVAKGSAYSKKLDRWVSDIGVCSQRDKFFGTVGGKLKEIHDVDMANIRRKAVTNLHSRLIKRCVGLMGVTTEDLVEAGLNVKKIQGIDYKKNNQKSRSRLSEKGKETLQKLGDMLLMMANNDKKRAKELLVKYSLWKDKEGKEHYADSLSKMTEKWLNTTYGKVKKEFDQIGKTEDGKQIDMDDKEEESGD